ncbi:MAG: hypothetical protein ACT4PK_04915 [Gammaproteobacteria bacterium]
MKKLRLLVALCLSLTVPAAALASVVNAGHCQMKPAARASTGAHAGHDMGAMQHAQHMQQMAAADAPAKSAPSGCTCGCKCTSDHCVSGASGLLTGPRTEADFVSSDGSLRTQAMPSRTASAHHLDLLRPPSLT